MANVLSDEKRLRVLAGLVDGNSIRAVSRMTDVHQDTIGRFALKLGEAASRLHNRIVRDLRSSLVQMDEVWSYVQVKESRVQPHHPEGSGEAYTFVALCALSRLVLSYHVGRRDQASMNTFMGDVRARLAVMPQMTSDGFAPYISAVGAEFGPSAPFAQTVKNYAAKPRRDEVHRYEPARGIKFITKKVVSGTPNMGDASTALVERNNLTTRHHVGRMRRLCLAFSKRLPNHRAAIALHFAWYNLCHVVKTIRVTPAMAAGITDHIWDISELLAVLLAEGETDKPAKLPLEHPKPAEPARALPNGRGFLRLVKDPVAPAPRAPTPGPHPSPAAPAMPVPAVCSGSWEQMGLFGDDA